MDAPDSAASRLAAAAALLEASGDYRVLRRYLPHDEFAPVPPGVTPRRALVIDTETTGADPRSDQLIELALLAFDFDPQSGAIYGVTGVYDGFDDPGRPIPAEAMAIHGITDEMVAGRALDEPRVEAMLEGAEWVIAHNAAFDRPILERRMPQFRALRWACSNVDVPWAAEGFSGSKLQYLATQQGFFFEGHRSEIDCRALLEVLSRPLLKSGAAPLGVLLRTAAQPRLRFWATGSPFESKDLLKARRYRWDAERRCWSLTVVGDEAALAEADWLRSEVYRGRRAEIEVEVLDATVRFSDRPGPRRKRML
jgi:DNA polymerase-3 subunit epsilon